jgi:hypothetical protein
MGMRMVLVYVILSLTAVRAFGQDYEIRLTRDARIGQKYELTSSTTNYEQMTMAYQGQVPQESTSSIAAELEGTVTVLDIDSLKRATKLNMIISKFLVSRNEGKEEEALPKGSQVVAQLRKGSQEFLIDGHKASKNMTQILNLLFSLSKTDTTDDDIFGTKDRKKIGDNWPINNIKAAADLFEKAEIYPEYVKGTTTIERMVEIDDIKCLHIRANVDISEVAPPLPPGIAVEQSAISATYSGDFPIDLSLDGLADEMVFSLSVEGYGKFEPEAPEVTMSVRMKQSREAKRKPL